jgi:hypothetical protein
LRNVFSFHNFGEYVLLEKNQKLFHFLVLGFKPPLPNPNFLKLSRAHKTSIKNISASLKFHKMGYEAPEWPRSDLGSFELGAPDPIMTVDKSLHLGIHIVQSSLIFSFLNSLFTYYMFIYTQYI